MLAVASTAVWTRAYTSDSQLMGHAPVFALKSCCLLRAARETEPRAAVQHGTRGYSI